MNGLIDSSADVEVVPSHGTPERLMKFAEEGLLSVLTLATLLEPISRRAFLDACAAIEQQFTHTCATTDCCLQDGCAMDGEACLQSILKTEPAFRKACGTEWVRFFRDDRNRVRSCRSDRL